MRQIIRKGWVWNPMTNYPRNVECWCGSKIKAKKCCLPNLSPIVTKRDAEKIREALKAFDEKK